SIERKPISPDLPWGKVLVVSRGFFIFDFRRDDMNVKIVLTYQTVKGTEMTLYSDEMQAKKAIVLAEDLEKTGRIKSMFFSDRHENRWTLKQLKAYMEDIQTEAHNVTVYFDGGFHLNSKKSGLGCVVYYTKNEKLYRLRKNALVEELHTNN